MKPRVILESPFGRNVDGSVATFEEIGRNIIYARRAMKDSLDRGEAPYASHLLYPQVYDDAAPEERRAGMEAGFAWGAVAEMVAVYEDYGLTPGMQEGVPLHVRASPHIKVRHRKIGKNP